MELRDSIKIAITVVSLAAVSILIVSEYRRRRKFKNSPARSCYLHSDQKPQFSFKRVLADNSYSAFKHLKLDDALSEKLSNCHPYESEIRALLKNPYPEFNFIGDDIDLRMGDSYTWVDTESQLMELANTLSTEKAFAVDTEQHSLRSFRGFTALIQISTLREDYVVDTIALHDVMGILRPIFADHSICKVFHGADNDVLWLQRDFHIYVVNLFDTAKACDVLSKPQRSLAYLLETLCGITTDKSLQRGDWRQRPLPKEMVHYARTDAHYLLSIANSLAIELIEWGKENSSCPDDKFHFLREASQRSNMIGLQLYAKEIESCPGDAAASSLLSRQLNGNRGVSLPSSEPEDLVRRLCAWRDLMARVHDESLRYVLSDQAIIAIANKRPTTLKEIRSVIARAELRANILDFNSLVQFPSPVVDSHLDDVHQLIQNNLGGLDSLLPAILKKCLGPDGICPLSAFSYALLINYTPNLTSRLVFKPNGAKSLKQASRKASRDLFVKKFSCKSPVYHNCRIYANDGRLLCYCDRRKLEWYLSRNLAKLVEENPPAIMLLFEPKGRPEDEDNDFYIQSKKNICVGCGEGDHYLRYRIIPSCYRIHFPEHLKSHRSHDIVLLCVDCHEIAHAAAEKYKRQIAFEFGISLYVRKVIDSDAPQNVSSESTSTCKEAGVSPLQLRTAAMALLRHGHQMPANRREELIQVVKRYYSGREITEQDLERVLVVGMSPHERRRFEKKNGVSLKKSVRAVLHGNSDKTSSSGSVFSETAQPEFVLESRVEDPSNTVHTDMTSLGSSRKDIGGNIYDDNVREKTLEKSEFLRTKNVYGNNTDDKCGSESIRNGDTELSSPKYDGKCPPSHHSKLSLLGHGPHGEHVVEYLLTEQGEDGIREFCQRWRQVFVDAVKPRFLPAGWDIRHSGKREFGEFSVYNASKKASASRRS